MVFPAIISILNPKNIQNNLCEKILVKNSNNICIYSDRIKDDCASRRECIKVIEK